jgi:XTP/dITP diphosphohydrolase
MSHAKLLLATRNSDKIIEIKNALAALPIQIIAADEIPGLPQIIEDQNSLEENAVKKAVVLSKAAGMLTLADDTGLEVDALTGAPGIYTSRYAGENATYADNINKLLKEMQNVPSEQRSARFRCIIAVAFRDYYQTVEGICYGTILQKRQGLGGFGYDPVFFVTALHRTMAELTVEEKNEISHRGIAIRNSIEILKKFIAVE